MRNYFLFITLTKYRELFLKLFYVNQSGSFIAALAIIGVCISIPHELQREVFPANIKTVMLKAVVFAPPLSSNPPAKIPQGTPLLKSCVKKPEQLYHPIIIKAASRYRVDSALVKAIIMTESSYNPRAISKKGARGLMQLMPRTAAGLGVEDSFNPEHNINGGVKYFKQLLDQFDGNIKLALAAYNAGSRKVRKYKGIPPYKETQEYVERVFKYYEYYKKNMV